MILATVDIEDLATPKLAGVRSALDETANAMRSFAQNNPQVVQAAQAAQQAGAQIAAQSTRVAGLTQTYQANTQAAQQHTQATQAATRAHAAATASAGRLTDTLALIARQSKASADELAKSAREAEQLAKTYERLARRTVTLTDMVSKTSYGPTSAKEAQALRDLENALKGLGTPTAQKALENLKALGELNRSPMAGQNNQRAYAATLREITALLQQQGETVRKGAGDLKVRAEVERQVANEAKRALQERREAERQLAAAQQEAAKAEAARMAQLTALAVAFATLTAGLKSYLQNSVEIAARNEVLGTVTEVVAENAGIMTGTMLGQIAVVKDLGITTKDATEAVVDFAQANLDVADASKVARVAQDLAVVAGKDTSETVQTLTRVIQTQQVQMLRQFGITRTAGAVMAEYAREVGKATRDLTALDRQQAIVNLILKEGAAVTGAYERSMDDAGKKASSLSRYQEELADKIGTMLLPVYEKWIDLQTEAYKTLIALPPGAHAVIAAIGLITAALAALATAVTGGGALAAAGTFLSSIASGATAAAAASSGAAAGAGVLAGVMSSSLLPVIGLVVAALAILAGAWVYLSAQEQAAAVELKTARDEVLKNNAEIANLTEAVTELGNRKARTAGETQKLRDMVAQLNEKTAALAGGTHQAAYAFNEETGKIDINTTALRNNTQAVLANNRAKYGQQKAAQEEAYRQFKDLETQTKQAEERLRRVREQSTEEFTAQFLGGDPGAGAVNASKIAEADVERLAASRDAAYKRAVALYNENEPLRALFPEERFKNLVASLDKARVDAVNATGKSFDEIITVVQTKGDAAQKALVRAYQDMRKAAQTGVDTQDPSLIVEGAEGARMVASIEEAFAQISEAAKKAAEKASNEYAQAYQNMRERIKGETVQMRAQAQALNEEVLRILEIKDPEQQGAAWERYVQRFGATTKELGQAIDDLAEDAPKLKAAFQELQMREVGGWVEQMTDDIDQALTAATEASNDIYTKLGVDLTDRLYNSQQRLKADRRQINQEIFESDRDLYEQNVVAYMHANDQIRYAEERRMVDLERRFEQEREMREEMLDEQRKQVEDAIAGAKRETDAVFRNVRIRMDARIEEALLTRALQQGTTMAQVQEFAAELDRLRDFMHERLEVRRQEAQDSLKVEADLALARVDANREAYDQLTKDQKAALERQRAQGQENVRQQINDYTLLMQTVRTVFTSMASGAAEAFKGLLTQTMSFKDAFLAIWNSILRGVQNVFTSMVESWIGNAQRMSRTSSGGFSVGGFIRGLLGQGMHGGQAGVGGQWGSSAMQYGQSVYGMFGGAGTVGAGFGAGAARGSIAGIDGLGATGAGLAKSGGLWAGKTGFATSGMGAAMLGGGAGAIVGGAVASRYADGSYVKGALSGAASGAVAGGAVGGWVGAGIGAVAGGISGWWQARKQRKQMEEDRKAIIENAGGLENLRMKAEEAGVSIDRMLKTKSVKEFQQEVNKLDAAFTKLEKDQLITAAGGVEEFKRAAAEAGTFEQSLIDAFVNGTLPAERMEEMLAKIKKDLELKEAKDGLARTVTQMDALRKAAVLAGYDLKKLYDAKSIEEFNAQQAAFNKLLEEQEHRLQGLNRSANGFAMRVSGAAETFRRDIEGFVSGLTDEQKRAYEDIVKNTQEGDKSVIQQLRESMFENRMRVGDLDLSVEDTRKLEEVFARVQQSINAVGSAAATTFGGMLRETGDLYAALAAVDEPLSVINQMIRETGAQAPEALRVLLALQQTAKDNNDIVLNLQGISEMIRGLSDAGQLTAAQFNTFGADVAAQWQEMEKRGVAADQALLLMQPTLQALYEAQKNFGFATDESTQAMIDLGVEHGLVGDQFQSINQKMLDMLVIIAEAVGGTVPEAYRRQTQAAQEAASAQEAAAQAAAAEQARLAEEAAKAGLAMGGAADASQNMDAQGIAQIATQAAEAGRAVDDMGFKIRATDEEVAGMLGISVEEFKMRLKEAEQAMGEAGLGGVAEQTRDRVKLIDEQKLDAVKAELNGTRDASYRIVDGADAAKQALIKLVEDTREPLHELERNINAISLGRSPGGLKEIRIKADDGIAAIQSLGREVISNALAMERAINRAGLDALSMPDGETNPLGAAFVATQLEPPRREREDDDRREPAGPPLQVSVTFNVPVSMNSLDPSKAPEAWEIIRPGFEQALRNNTKQVGSLIEDAARRSRRRVTS